MNIVIQTHNFEEIKALRDVLEIPCFRSLSLVIMSTGDEPEQPSAPAFDFESALETARHRALKSIESIDRKRESEYAGIGFAPSITRIDKTYFESTIFAFRFDKSSSGIGHPFGFSAGIFIPCQIVELTRKRNTSIDEAIRIHLDNPTLRAPLSNLSMGTVSRVTNLKNALSEFFHLVNFDRRR